MNAKGCGECTVHFAENVVDLCDARGKGEECKKATIDALLDFIEYKKTPEQFVDTLKKIFGKDYSPGETEKT